MHYHNVNHHIDERTHNKMVDLLLVHGVTDAKVISAILHVERQLFLPNNLKSLADSDANIHYKEDRFLIDISTLGYMLMVAELKPQDCVLVIGGGVGYASVVISAMVKNITVLEEDISLLQKADEIQSSLQIKNINLINANLNGETLKNVFDTIIIEGAFGNMQSNWINLLKNEGTLVGIHRENNYSRIIKATKINEKFVTTYYKQVPSPFIVGLVGKQQFEF